MEAIPNQWTRGEGDVTPEHVWTNGHAALGGKRKSAPRFVPRNHTNKGMDSPLTSRQTPPLPRPLNIGVGHWKGTHVVVVGLLLDGMVAARFVGACC